MSEVTTGFVEVINKYSPQGADWTAYSMKIMDTDGKVSDTWYQLGFKPVDNIAEGDYIRFTHKEGKKGARSVELSSIKKAPADKTPEKPASSFGGNKGAYKGGKAGSGAVVKTSELFGEIGGYNTEDDIRRMSYSAARASAIDVISALLAADALPISGAKTKAGQADRFETVTSAIDKLTVEFYFDAATGRKIEVYSDDGSLSGGSQSDELPDGGVDESEGDAFGEAEDSFDDAEGW